MVQVLAQQPIVAAIDIGLEWTAVIAYNVAGDKGDDRNLYAGKLNAAILEMFRILDIQDVRENS